MCGGEGKLFLMWNCLNMTIIKFDGGQHASDLYIIISSESYSTYIPTIYVWLKAVHMCKIVEKVPKSESAFRKI